VKTASVCVALFVSLSTTAALGAPEPLEPHAGTRPADELTLSAALAELDHQNLTLVQARSRAKEASAVVREAQAALLPTAAVTGTYTRNSSQKEIDLGSALPPALAASAPDSILIQPLAAWTATASLRVPLFALNAWYDVNAAKAAARATALQVEVARQELRTGFSQTAYAAEALEQVVAASERAITLASEQTSSAERRVQAGTAAPLDVLRARAEFVRRESDLARAQAELQRARLALGVLLGRPRPVKVAVPELAEPRAAAARSGARPELDALRARQAAARAQVDSAWARLVPQLSATGSAFASDVPYLTGDKSGWRVTVDLVVPLYDGGLRYGKRREAEAALQTAGAALAEQRLRIDQEVQDAERDMAVAREQGRLAAAQQALAADAAASAKRSYDAGVATALDVLDANDKLYRADVAVAEARARAAQAFLAYQRAVGQSR
jgi:outer membrane protein TolC